MRLLIVNGGQKPHVTQIVVGEASCKYKVMLKKYFIISLVLFNLLFGLASAGPINAADLSDDIAAKSGYGPANEYSLSITIGKIIKVALSLVGTIFLVLTIYAGFLWMTAGGGEEQLTKAKAILKTSVTGLLIVLASYSITYFVMFYAFQTQH